MSEEIGEACSPSALDAPVAVTSGSPVPWGFSNLYREHCASCGSFVNTSRPGTAWAAVGEFGEDTEYTCHRCTAKPGFRLLAGNGTADPKWCGYVMESGGWISFPSLVSHTPAPKPALKVGDRVLSPAGSRWEVVFIQDGEHVHFGAVPGNCHFPTPLSEVETWERV